LLTNLLIAGVILAVIGGLITLLVRQSTGKAVAELKNATLEKTVKEANEKRLRADRIAADPDLAEQLRTRHDPGSQ